MRAKTLNRGADDERNAILRYLRRRRKLFSSKPGSCGLELDVNIAWVEGRSKRTKAKKGGIG